MYILPGALAPLAAYRQFILVQFVPRNDGSGKSDKYPMHPHELRKWNAHDPVIWMDVSTAAALAERLGGLAAGWGVGFVITKNDPIICLDLDGAADGHGGWSANTLEMLGKFPGAMEVSNSGTGLHVWSTYMHCPDHGMRNKLRNMELYSDLRFIALGSSCSGQMQDVTAILPGFIDSWFLPQLVEENGLDWTLCPTPDYSPLTDDELLAKAMLSTPKAQASAVFGTSTPMASFADLWTRNVAVLSKIYPPAMPHKEFNYSDADYALAKDLMYWTGKNCERAARLMQMSALKREKWDVKVHKDYFHDTIMIGYAACKQVHHVKPIVPDTVKESGAKLIPEEIRYQTFIGRENLAVLFAGCVYVRDENKVLLPNGDLVDQARFKVQFAGYTFSMDNENQKVSKDAWEAFTANSIIRFPRVEGCVFEPTLPFQDLVHRGGRSWVNTYKKPDVIMAPGDVTVFMDLLKKLLPNGDDALILLSYLAALCQYPGVKFRWAPFIQGTPGNGKSTIVSCIKYALGNKYIFSIKKGMIENNFNSWLENNRLYVADDIYSSKDRTDMMEALKSMITEEDHGITLKGIDSIQKKICGNFIFTDNHKDAMKKTDDTRRICTLYCAQQSTSDRIRDGLTKKFFVRTFIPWLRNGGFSAVAHMLYTMEIDPRYNPADECQEAPDTSVTREAIIDGRTSVEHEVAEWIELKEPGFCGDFVSETMLKRKIENQTNIKSMGYLKIKEMMNRLGYEIHRGMDGGRCDRDVQPDNKRSVLYVKRDTLMAEVKGAEQVTQLYALAQQAALTAAIEKRFTNV